MRLSCRMCQSSRIFRDAELVDRMLEYQPPPNLTEEMGEAVDDVIKYRKTTAELRELLMNMMKISEKSLEFANRNQGGKPPPIPFYVKDTLKKLSPSNYQTYRLDRMR